MTNTTDTMILTALSDAKKARAAARRAEAKGDFARAMLLRDQAAGCLDEANQLKQHGQW